MGFIFLYYGVFGINRILLTTITLNKNKVVNYIIIVMNVILFILNVVIFLHVLLHIFTKDKRLLYEKTSKTKVVVIIKKHHT